MARRAKSQSQTAPAQAPIEEPQAEPVQAEEPQAEQAETAQTSRLQPCRCGCGAEGKGRFRPGHDARLHGRVARAQRGDLDIATLPAAERAAVEEHLGMALHGSFAQAASRAASTTRTPEQRRVVVAERRLERAMAELRAAHGALLQAASQAGDTSDLLETVEWTAIMDRLPLVAEAG